MAHFLRKIRQDLEEKVDSLINPDAANDQNQAETPVDAPLPAPQEAGLVSEAPIETNHRFSSFAPQTTGHAKWYVDGASYFWAVSIALEGR
jgi:phospholipase D1/2